MISLRIHYFKLPVVFALALVSVIVVLNFIFGLIVHFFDSTQSIWWHVLSPAVIIGIFLLCGLNIFYRQLIYKGDGRFVAKHLRAKAIERLNAVPNESIALQINDEIASLCGVKPAYLFVLNDELGINAFTVGFGEKDASIVLTWGALQSMDYPEIKALIAQQYVHIQSNAFIEHTRLFVWCSGFLFFSQLGSVFVVKGTKRKSLVMDSKFAAIYVAWGGFIWLLGSLGVLISRIVKFLLYVRREYPVDQQTLSFVAEEDLLHALSRIYVHTYGSQLFRVESEALAHMCFANALTEQSWFRVHAILSDRIDQLHDLNSQIFKLQNKNNVIDWKKLAARFLLPTNETRVLEIFDTSNQFSIQPSPVLRLSPISFATKDAINPLARELRQGLKRPEVIIRAMQTSAGSREVILAIFMIRQYREFIPDDAEVSRAIVEALLQLDGRVHLQIFDEALQYIDRMPNIISHHYLKKIAKIIQADGEIGLLDSLLFVRVKSTQSLLEPSLPVIRENCLTELVVVVDAMLHVQQIDSLRQVKVRQRILKKILKHHELQAYTRITEHEIDLGQCIQSISGLLYRQRMYLLAVIEQEMWTNRSISQDELDVLELLYWRFGFESNSIVDRMLKQNSLMI